MTILWPRLDRPAAVALLAERRHSQLEALSAAAAMSHPTQTFASTGGSRSGQAVLAELRRLILDAAQGHGFPSPPADPIAFDRVLAPRLLDAMPMSLGEAVARPVWSFVALVLAPDVTAWRFGFGNDERWVCSDRTRHMFSRLWWQAYTLTDDGPSGRDSRLLDGLSESDLNQILERTTIGGCRPLARALASEVLLLDPGARHRDVVREASLRILRLTAVIDPYALDDAEISVLARQVVRATADLLNVGS